jgi:hypothetical protein
MTTRVCDLHHSGKERRARAGCVWRAAAGQDLSAPRSVHWPKHPSAQSDTSPNSTGLGSFRRLARGGCTSRWVATSVAQGILGNQHRMGAFSLSAFTVEWHREAGTLPSGMLHVALVIDRAGVLNAASTELSSGERWQEPETVGNTGLVPGSAVAAF